MIEITQTFHGPEDKDGDGQLANNNNHQDGHQCPEDGLVLPVILLVVEQLRNDHILESSVEVIHLSYGISCLILYANQYYKILNIKQTIVQTANS